MKNFDARYESNKKFCLSNISTIQELCKPIFKLLGVHGFTFQRIYRNGDRLYFSNSAAWIENFYENNYFQVADYSKYAQLDAFTLWKHWPKYDDGFYKLMADAKENFNYGNGLVINQVTDSYVDAFTLRGFPEDDLVNNRYLSELISIQKFLEYFIITAEPIIQQAQNYSIYIPEKTIALEESSLHKRGDKNQIFSGSLPHRLIYYTRTGKLKYFSDRETECIFLLVRGKTAKGIAKILNISPRTVEFYIDVIKSKLLCNARSDIIEKLIHFKWNQYILFANYNGN